jgi:hypothetical protein
MSGINVKTNGLIVLNLRVQFSVRYSRLILSKTVAVVSVVLKPDTQGAVDVFSNQKAIKKLLPLELT